jgi:hypothetical protein
MVVITRMDDGHTFIVHVVQHVVAVPAELPGAAAPPQQLHPRPHPHPHLPPSTAVRSGRDAHTNNTRECQIKHITVPVPYSTVWDKFRLATWYHFQTLMKYVSVHRII